MDKKKKNLFDLNFRKDMPNQQRANFALAYPLSAKMSKQTESNQEDSARHSTNNHRRQLSDNIHQPVKLTVEHNGIVSARNDLMSRTASNWAQNPVIPLKKASYLQTVERKNNFTPLYSAKSNKRSSLSPMKADQPVQGSLTLSKSLRDIIKTRDRQHVNVLQSQSQSIFSREESNGNHYGDGK